MKSHPLAAGILMATVATVATVAAAQAQAEVIERACNQSGRAAANRRLCGCIQDVANLTLTRGEQRIAAGFLADPDKAQAMRQSNRRSDEKFWQRYLSFGTTAEAYCTF